MNTTLAVLAIGLGLALILQAVVLRAACRRRLARLQARHLQAEQEIGCEVERAKRRIGQLQADLSAARLQLRRLAKSAAAPVQGGAAARQALERELDDASASRRHLPVDGFADTEVSAQDTQHGSLLLQ